MELFLRFVGLVDVSSDFRLHDTSSMIDRSINHAVLDGFGDNVLCILLRLEVEFDADILQADARVGQRDSPECSLDDEVTKSQNEEMGTIRQESLFVRAESLLESGDISHTDS